MIDYVYAIEPDMDTGKIYELIKIKVLSEMQDHYILRGYADLRKEEAFITPESAIEAYRTKLKEALATHEAKVMNAKVELATLECTFQDQIEGLPKTDEELEHAKRHKVLYEYFEELVADWFDHEEWAIERGTVLNLEQWAHKQSNELDYKRH